ncbi:MAG: CRISPR-associated protein Cas4 [Nitrososphaerota archaeon]|nr:CRISPR-associated protein Cas4 [Nitrososphaerota archaeon]
MSDDERPLIPVSLIRQYHFCPRTIFFSQVLGVGVEETELMRAGRVEQGREERRDKRRKTPLSGLEDGGVRSHQVHLRSVELGLEGVVDLLVEGRELVVVERKYARLRGRPPRGHLYQAAAYAMLVEAVLGRPVRRAYLHYLRSGDRVVVEISGDLRRHVLWTIGRIREIIDGERLPEFVPRPGCGSCDFRRVCQYV